MDGLTSSQRNYLVALAKRQPKLGELVSLALEPGVSTDTFWTFFHRNTLNGQLKVQLFEGLFGSTQAPAASPVEFHCLFDFLVYHPKKPLEFGLEVLVREDIPSYFASRFSIKRTSPITFFNKLTLAPYILAKQGIVSPIFQHYNVKPKHVESALRPFFLQRIMTDETADALLHEHISTQIYRNYFDTGNDALNLYNCMWYVSRLIETDKRGGTIQNKIPALISQLLSIPRLSLIQLYLTLDILVLMYHNIIDPDAIERDPMAMLTLYNLVHTRPGGLDFQAVTQRLKSAWLMDDTKADVIYMRRELDERLHSGYESGLYFNLERLLDKHSSLRKFQYYYSLADADRMMSVLRAHFTSFNPEFFKQIQRRFTQSEPEFSGLQCRDIANCLYLSDCLYRYNLEPRLFMPTVAFYRLGMKEYEQSNNPYPEPRKPGPKKPRFPVHLPLLDKLESIN
jgi:hypothetical protein